MQHSQTANRDDMAAGGGGGGQRGTFGMAGNGYGQQQSWTLQPGTQIEIGGYPYTYQGDGTISGTTPLDQALGRGLSPGLGNDTG